jgi:hypothetical protein
LHQHGHQSALDGGVRDLDGNPRIDSNHRIVDRGCYEYRYRDTLILAK